ncbi:MAG TPA: hypothetical protein VHO03_09360 [Ignavibacteriales bacterium]|nr:hypothetical protein [Ignavibacteriales bacterium]
MKRSLVFVFLSLTLLSGLSHAQTSFYGGIRLSGSHLSTNNFPRYQPTINWDPSLSLGLKFANGLSLEGRGGYLISDYYGGMQLGLYARKDIYDILFATAGINFLNTSPSSGYSLANDLGGGSIHTMLGGGLGLNTTENSFFEFQYMRPLNQDFGHSSFLDWQRQPRSEYWKVYGIYKLTFGYNFSFAPKPAEEKTALEKNKAEGTPVSYSRPSLFLGFGLGGNIMSGNNIPSYISTFNLEPGLNLGLNLNKNFALEGRFGIALSEDLGGMEYGLFAKGNILQDFLYAIGGINFLNSFESSHGTLIYEENNGGTHTMLGGGIGIHSPDGFFLELQYFKNLNEEFGRSSNLSSLQPQTSYWTVGSIVKVSLGYNFSLTSKSGQEKTAGVEKPVIEKKEPEESAVEIVPGRRHLFLAGGTGFPELLDAQLGYQIMDNLSVAGILNYSVFQDPEFKNFTAGLKLTGYFAKSGFNNVSLEYSKQVEHLFTGNDGGPVTLTAGNDNMFSDRHFHFVWAAGLMAWADMVLPVFKLGTNFNF